ncbi:MAG: universal stress protein [Flavisolibacter sp.]|nr:universal stress protein [Flavisolibacter sp.]
MEKIITALDGLRLSRSAIEYTVFVAQYCKAHVVGVFLDDLLYHSYSFSELMATSGGFSNKKMQQLDDRDKATRDESVQAFEQMCQQASLEYSVHRNKNVALQELLHETIYADLLIIDSKETFTPFEKEPPTEFLRDLLTDVQCPVLVVPQAYRPVEKLVLLYDGEPSSVYAVKMFSYLLPDLKYMETEVLTIKDEDETLHVPDNRLMKEFMKRHFGNADYNVLNGDAEEQIINYLNRFHEDVLVVLGAYRRSRVSRWFKPSMADHLLKHLKLPLFIAHNN